MRWALDAACRAESWGGARVGRGACGRGACGPRRAPGFEGVFEVQLYGVQGAGLRKY